MDRRLPEIAQQLLLIERELRVLQYRQSLPAFAWSVPLHDALQSKPELNGRKGKVVGVLDRSNGRVAIELDAAEGEAAEASKSSRRLAVKSLASGVLVEFDQKLFVWKTVHLPYVKGSSGFSDQHLLEGHCLEQGWQLVLRSESC